MELFNICNWKSHHPTMARLRPRMRTAISSQLSCQCLQAGDNAGRTAPIPLWESPTFGKSVESAAPVLGSTAVGLQDLVKLQASTSRHNEATST